MANNLTQNPWYIDTASANYLRSGLATPQNQQNLTATGGPKGKVWITSITWSGYAATTDQFVIKDPNGNVIFSSKGRANLDPVQLVFHFPLQVWDLAVTTLVAGVIAISLK